MKFYFLSILLSFSLLAPFASAQDSNIPSAEVSVDIVDDTALVELDEIPSLDSQKETESVAEDINYSEESAFWEKYLKNYSWPVMSFVLGLIDGVNPCAMWSLMVLIGFLITMESKARRWIIGSVFLISGALMYAGALLAYLFGFREITLLVSGGVIPWLFRGVGVLALLSALFSFYAYWKNKVECEIRNPEEKRNLHNKLSNLLKKEDLFLILPGVILLSVSVNAVELLCSFAIPTAFVATLIQMKVSLLTQLTAITIYDVAYMLDDIIMFVVAMITLSYAIVSPKVVRISHLVGGIILFILGYLLLFHPSILSSISSGIN